MAASYPAAASSNGIVVVMIPSTFEPAGLQQRHQFRPGLLHRSGGQPDGQAADQAGQRRQRVGLQVVHADDGHRAAGAHGIQRVVDGGVGADRVDDGVHPEAAGGFPDALCRRR